MHQNSGERVAAAPPPRRPSRARAHDATAVDAVVAHMQRWIGPVTSVFEEIRSTWIHADVVSIAPTESRPYYTLFTVGMSDRIMNGPAEARHAELMLCLPASWCVSSPLFAEPRFGWPLEVLCALARLPHERDTWLGWGRVVPHGKPPAPFAEGTSLCGSLLLAPTVLPPAAHEVVVSPRKTVCLWSVVPLFADELALAREAGEGRLADLLAQSHVNEILDPRRRSVVQCPTNWHC